ncbi:MAG: MMPL family transporter [Paludibacteraceae bacterium]|nr:MMPL family transporter [Paludibacteraceae bacterium]
MTRFTIAIFKYFQQHKIVFYACMLLSFFFFAFFGSKMVYEEDITKLLPSDSDGDNSKEMVFANLKVKDKMFVVLKMKDNSVDVSKLSEACDSLVEDFMATEVAKEMVTDVLYKVDADMIQGSVASLYKHLPIFLDSADYTMLDSLTTKAQIENQMQKNLMTLYSPMGSVMGQVIAQDPLAFREMFMSKKDAMKDGLGSNYTVINQHFFSPDSAIALAFISPNFKTVDSKLSTKLISQFDENIQKLGEIFPEIDVYYHGAAPQSVGNSKQIKHDLVMTLSVSMLFALLVIGLCYRNRSTLFQLAVPIVYGFFFALCVIYFIKGQLSLLALGIGAIVLGVAVSYCLHVITHYKYVGNPIRVLEEQSVPVFLGCLTTIGAFMSLMFTEAELLKDFGLFASLALLGTTFFCLIFLPQFFSEEKNKRNEKAFEILEKINSYPFERKTYLIGAIVVISLICFVTSRWVNFDSDLTHIAYYDSKILKSQEILAEHTTKDCKTVYFAAVSPDLDSALAYSKKMESVLANQKDVYGKVRSYGSSSHMIFIPTEEQKARLNRWSNFWTDEKKKQVLTDLNEAALKVGFTPEMFVEFQNMLVENQQGTLDLVSANILPSSLMSNMIEYTDGKYMVFTPVNLLPKDKKEVCDEVTKIPHLVVIDPYYYTSNMVELINDDFSTTLLISSLFVLCVLLISYRSVCLALVAFLPMSLSWFIVLGIMGIFNMQFNLINIVISTFIFGIGVDYSIFVMDGLLSEFRIRKNVLVFHKTAILFSAFVLIVSIASLMFATHPAVKSIGLSTLIGMSTAVIISYSLEPFLFYWLIKRPTLKKKSPVTLFNILHGEAYFKLGKDHMSLKQQIRNNYEYKGYDVEKMLKHELVTTHNYTIFNPIFPLNGQVLEYGCGYGFKSYWFGINNREANILGYDTDEDKILLAENCYLKDEKIQFTTDKEKLNQAFDVVIVNEGWNINDIETSLEKARYVITYKGCESDILGDNFIKENEDELFVLYRAKRFYK